MKPKDYIHIKNSIATTLLKVVFSFYLVVAVSVTVGHMVVEYRHQRSNIIDDLKGIQDTFEQGLALEVWQLHTESIVSTIEGMMKMPVVVGVRIQNTNGLDIAFGYLHPKKSKNDKLVDVNLLGLGQDKVSFHLEELSKTNVFHHQFPIAYTYNGESQELGKVTIYSNTSVVYQRVKMGFMLLVINAVIKTVALWLIFLWFSNRLLRRPLSRLASEAKQVSLKNLDSFNVKVETAGRNELKLLEESLNSMIGNMRVALDEREQVENALRQSEKKFRSLFEQAGDYILLLEVTEDKNLLIVNANHAACEIHGYTREKLIGKQIKDLDVGLNENEVKIILDRVIGGETVLFETRHLRKDGTVFPIEVSSKLLDVKDGRTTIISIERDLSERKKNEIELREAEEKFRNIFEHSPMGIVHFDNQGVIRTCNAKIKEILGATQGNMIGFDALKYVVDKQMREAIILALSGETSHYEGNYVSVTGGVARYIHAVFSPIVSNEQAAMGVIGIFEDITRRKKIEEEKEDLENQLRQAYKMEAIGTMAGGIAHDFNNILTVILGNADMAKDDIPAGNPAEYNIDQVLEASLRAKELVRQILTFSRKSKQELLPLQPFSIIRESLKMLRSTTPTSISIVQDICENDCRILADSTQLHQLLMNLFSNAVQAMDEKGTISLKVDIVDLNQLEIDRFSGLAPGEYLLIQVSDTGTGMDKETLERIYDPFFTTKEVDEGTGMGLSIVHGIVKSHNGFINVDSTPGEGTIFSLLFPIIDVVQVQEQQELDNEFPGGDERILFVDDEEMLAEMGRRLLTRQGYHVTAQTSSATALEIFKNDPEAFDLVITDQSMPNMTGVELSAELIMIRPDIPIILCTGYSKKVTVETCRELGIKAFCFKPLNKKELSQTVRKVLDESSDHVRA